MREARFLHQSPQGQVESSHDDIQKQSQLDPDNNISSISFLSSLNDEQTQYYPHDGEFPRTPRSESCFHPDKNGAPSSPVTVRTAPDSFDRSTLSGYSSHKSRRSTDASKCSTTLSKASRKSRRSSLKLRDKYCEERVTSKSSETEGRPSVCDDSDVTIVFPEPKRLFSSDFSKSEDLSTPKSCDDTNLIFHGKKPLNYGDRAGEFTAGELKSIENDDLSIGSSSSMFSQSESSEYDSIDYDYGCAGDINYDKCEIEPSMESASIHNIDPNIPFTGATSKRSTTNATASNAFETLPKRLINSSLIRQATATLQDERFISNRISKLGEVQASKIHVLDFVTLYEKIIHDAKKLKRTNKILDSDQLSTSSDPSNNETDASKNVTINSFQLFEKCIMDQLGISCILRENDYDSYNVSNISKTTLTCNDSEIDGKTRLANGGRALYALGKFCQKSNWDSDAMHFYRHALYLYFLDVGVEEARLLDHTDDCDGFFYIQAARNAVRHSSVTNKYLGTIFLKMGDLHTKNDDGKNDALRAYRASQEFWMKFVNDKISGSMEHQKNERGVVRAIEALALSFNRIGSVYICRGDLESALYSFHEALELQVEALGKDHIEVAKTLHNIGVCHRHRNDLDGALQFYQHAHQIFEINLGREHLDTVRTLHNIGGVHRRREEYSDAMDCFKEVLQVRRSVLGDNHPSVSITLVSIAAVLRRSGRKEEAKKFYTLAVR